MSSSVRTAPEEEEWIHELSTRPGLSYSDAENGDHPSFSIGAGADQGHPSPRSFDTSTGNAPVDHFVDSTMSVMEIWSVLQAVCSQEQLAATFGLLLSALPEHVSLLGDIRSF